MGIFLIGFPKLYFQAEETVASSMEVHFKDLLQFVAKFNPATEVGDQMLGWLLSFFPRQVFYLKKVFY